VLGTESGGGAGLKCEHILDRQSVAERHHSRDRQQKRLIEQRPQNPMHTVRSSRCPFQSAL